MTREEGMLKWAPAMIIVHDREEELDILDRVKELDEALNDFCWSGLYKIVDNEVLRNLHTLLDGLKKYLEDENVDDVIKNENGDWPAERLVKVPKKYPYNLYTSYCKD